MKEKLIAYYLMIGFFLTLSHTLVGQDQRIADSLKIVLEKGNLEDSLQFEVLRNLAFNEQKDYDLALSYAEELILLAGQRPHVGFQAIGYYQKGDIKRVLGDLDEATKAFLYCIKLTEDTNNVKLRGSAYGALADIYSILNNHSNSMIYYNKAIAALRRTSDSIALASAILNAGDEYLMHEDYDSALAYFSESGEIFEKVDYPIGKAYNLGNIGVVHAHRGDNTQAEESMSEAIRILEEAEDFYPICFYLLIISDIYVEKKDLGSAVNYAGRSLQLARQYKLKQQISDANLKLSELHQTMDEHDKAFAYYRDHIAYRDSVNNIETVQKIADQRTDFEVNLREREIDLLEKNQTLSRTYIIIAVTLLILAVVLLLYFRQRFLTTKLISLERRKKNEQKIKDLLNVQESKALQSMVKGRDDERKRLAQELHNHLGSLLATIKVNINSIDQEDISNHDTLTALIDQACTDVRNISHELNMGISKDFGLIPALKELTSHLKKSRDIAVEFSAAMSDRPIESEEEITIYRIVQELVSNILKHADASKISISLTCFEEENLINIIVQDNGRGFEDKSNHPDSNGMGIRSLKQMVESLQGVMVLDSSTRNGTTVNIDLPLNPNTTEL